MKKRMETYCGVCCEQCGFQAKCGGCCKTGGNPFGGNCIAAEYCRVGGKESFEEFKRRLISEFNELAIPGMPKIESLCSLPGFYVNLAYPLPNGDSVKLLRDDRVYLGTQVACEFDDFSGKERCFGLVADTGFLLVCEYGENGIEPEIVVFRRR